MSTRLFLLRHGETQANIEQRYQGQGNADLSELGLRDSELLSKGLSKEEFSAIYSSTLPRSFETAQIVAKPHSIDVVKVSGLIERSYGKWENMKFNEIRDKYTDSYKQWLIDPAKTRVPGAELLEDLQKRGVEAIEKLIKEHKDETICVVGHGGINRAILFHYMHIDLNNFWRIKQDNCCVNLIEFDGFPMVTLLNSTWFLGEKRVKGGGYY
ncbi:histidine phosphatase family protein [Candidatus Margulisiibacteriota bacterium]